MEEDTRVNRLQALQKAQIKHPIEPSSHTSQVIKPVAVKESCNESRFPELVQQSVRNASMLQLNEMRYSLYKK
jgi:hypothetical protein